MMRAGYLQVRTNNIGEDIPLAVLVLGHAVLARRVLAILPVVLRCGRIFNSSRRTRSCSRALLALALGILGRRGGGGLLGERDELLELGLERKQVLVSRVGLELQLDERELVLERPELFHGRRRGCGGGRAREKVEGTTERIRSGKWR